MEYLKMWSSFSKSKKVSKLCLKKTDCSTCYSTLESTLAEKDVTSEKEEVVTREPHDIPYPKEKRLFK